MSTHLSRAEIASFRQRGFLGARRVLSEAEALRCRQAPEAFEAIRGDRDRPIPATDLHLLFRWAWALVRDARIVDPVTDLTTGASASCCASAEPTCGSAMKSASPSGVPSFTPAQAHLAPRRSCR